MKKRKLKKKFKLFIVLFILVIILATIIIKTTIYRGTYDYKLKTIGYSKEQIVEIIKLNDNYIDVILKKEYDENIYKFMNEKYFKLKNLDLYLEYYNSHSNIEISKIVSLVNVKANYEHYDNKAIEETDLSKGNLMLVNKYHYLSENYNPDINKVSIIYAYDENYLLEETMYAYIEMFKAAKKEDIHIIASSSYRTYEEQKELWDKRAAIDKKYADLSTARPGFSEHQTGLAIDILTYNTTLNDFEKTDEFIWLNNNAYKYGFILRYPKDKEDITGYEYESWHYRYVGIDVATKIHNENITFDEYYAYYLED